MSTSTIPSVAPIALQPGAGDARWFLGALGTIKAAAETTNGQLAVLEFLWPHGSGSPLHVHHNEDEWFYVIEGELTLWVGGQTVTAAAGSFVYGPRGIPHTFAISSEHARFLLVVEPGGFEQFVREIGEPALELYCERLARALAGVINILDPDVIVLGGGVSNVVRLYDAVPKLWPRHVFSDRIATRLLPPKHGDSSGVRGAAWLWEPARSSPVAPGSMEPHPLN